MVCNPTMEPSFYGDQEDTIYGHQDDLGRQNNIRRNNLTLDLNNTANLRNGTMLSKRNRIQSSTTPSSLQLTPYLDSPVGLKIETPELERMMVVDQDNTGVLHTPTLYFQDKATTLAQEDYVKGFVDALSSLHNSDSSQEPGNGILMNLDQPGSVQSTTDTTISHNSSTDGGATPNSSIMQIKDEPHHTFSNRSSPGIGLDSPINMETQEKIKLERKRQRNRLAASKCRKRKLERITKLEAKVNVLKGENNDLAMVLNRLRNNVSKLKLQVIDHANYGCPISIVAINGC